MPQILADRNRFAQNLFSTLPERYDRLAEVLSMGQNGRWRRAMVDRIVPSSPGRVLDVASGTAGVALQLASRTAADVTGVDFEAPLMREEVFGGARFAEAHCGCGRRLRLILVTTIGQDLQKTREIGIMKAIGASDSDVKRVFFAEAATMGLIGGVIGVALGWLIGRAINLGANLYLQRLKMPPEGLLMVPLWLALAAVLFAVLVSVVAGIYPAARAARLDPVEALRYE